MAEDSAATAPIAARVTPAEPASESDADEMSTTAKAVAGSDRSLLVWPSLGLEGPSAIDCLGLIPISPTDTVPSSPAASTIVSNRLPTHVESDRDGSTIRSMR